MPSAQVPHVRSTSANFGLLASPTVQRALYNIYFSREPQRERIHVCSVDYGRNAVALAKAQRWNYLWSRYRMNWIAFIALSTVFALGYLCLKVKMGRRRSPPRTQTGSIMVSRLQTPRQHLRIHWSFSFIYFYSTIFTRTTYELVLLHTPTWPFNAHTHTHKQYIVYCLVLCLWSGTTHQVNVRILWRDPHCRKPMHKCMPCSLFCRHKF